MGLGKIFDKIGSTRGGIEADPNQQSGAGAPIRANLSSPINIDSSKSKSVVYSRMSSGAPKVLKSKLLINVHENSQTESVDRAALPTPLKTGKTRGEIFAGISD